jgi:murein L,D-transpeptidase YafK
MDMCSKFFRIFGLVLLLAILPGCESVQLPDLTTALTPPPPPEPVMHEAAEQCVVTKILVTKSDRMMYLFDQNGAVMRTYPVSLGRNPEGRKMEEGDGKTPEGHYFIDTRNENSDYFLSLRISYPSREDTARAKKMCVKPGGAIFIHGTPNGKEWMTWKYNSKNDWTDGCIAVSNKDMKEIWSLVPDHTPITIVP